LYDPVIVVNDEGKFVGTVTVRTLFKHALDIEVKIAANSNPLTLLPGNVIIQKWIEEYTQQAPFTVVYADLDRFKEYNDSYGFTQGDNIIKLAGTILSKHIKRLGAHAHLGHLGGDDFIGVIKGEVSESILAKICEEFDYEKLRHFNDFHQEQGYFIAKDRKGNKTKVKLVTLSLSVITSNSAKPFDHPAKLGQIAASLKKKIKQRTAESGTSDFLIDRRRPNEKILY
jgi:diguanylate cyclase (GGDEF)-like protein